MILPRLFVIALAGVPLVACTTSEAPNLAATEHGTAFVARLPEELEQTSPLNRSTRPELARETVSYRGSEPPGTIVVKTGERRLYFVVENGSAIRYPVAVGAGGNAWYGRAALEAKHLKPAWSPPAVVKRDNPRVPDLIPSGAPNNPMGAAALMLRDGEYAIHGTNRPSSIGNSVTYGCIRMFNEDIIHLYQRVSVGTEVVVAR